MLRALEEALPASKGRIQLEPEELEALLRDVRRGLTSARETHVCRYSGVFGGDEDQPLFDALDDLRSEGVQYRRYGQEGSRLEVTIVSESSRQAELRTRVDQILRGRPKV